MEDTNSTDVYDFTPPITAWLVAKEIIFVLFSLAGMYADAMIIYILFRFRRMRKTENMFLANWAIADLISLLLTPSFYGVTSVLDIIPISRTLKCALVLIGETLHATVVVFVLVTLIDWMFYTYWPKMSKMYRNCYKYVIATVWIAAAIACSVGSGYCMVEKHYHHVFGLAIVVTFGAVLLIVIGLQLARCVQKFCIKRPLDKSTLTLTLATSFVTCWILFITIVIIMQAIRFFLVLDIPIEILMFCTSIVIFALLYKFNNDFRACLLQVWKRSNYEEAIDDFNNATVEHTNGNDSVSVQIATRNPSEGLLNNEF